MLNFICPFCKKILIQENENYLKCSACLKPYLQKDGLWHLLPPLSDFKKQEEDYHNEFAEDAVEIHQLQSFRNFYYHQKIWRFFEQLPKDSLILEIGAGSGFDARYLIEKFLLVELDVASGALGRLRQSLSEPERQRITLVAADGENLPFINNSFDGVLMIAILHHFPNPNAALKEMSRVLKNGGVAAIGVEPNHLYFNLIKRFRQILCRLSKTNEPGSRADEETSGFKKRELIKLIEAAGLKIEKIESMWFLAGFAHYFLEFIFRALKLKKRIRLTVFLEKIIVGFDRLFFRIPLADRLGWHWIVFCRKN